MNVVSHSIANIFKRLIVVLLLYGWGSRQATWFNFLGLLIASLGLGIYVLGKTRKTAQFSLTSFWEGFILSKAHWETHGSHVIFSCCKRIKYII